MQYQPATAKLGSCWWWVLAMLRLLEPGLSQAPTLLLNTHNHADTKNKRAGAWPPLPLLAACAHQARHPLVQNRRARSS